MLAHVGGTKKFHMDGWVKTHRSIMDNPLVCKDADHYAVWGYLLHKAAHAERPAIFGGKKIMLQPGQLIAGRKVIADHFGISESKVKRVLIAFENDQQIARQRGNASSLISVTNWAKYQSNDQQNDQPVTSDWTANDQPVTTYIRNKELKKERNIAHTHRVKRKGSVRENQTAIAAEPSPRAVSFLEWLDATYPDIAAMPEPITPEQAEAICRKLSTDDIIRIVEAMHNKRVAERNASAYCTFVSYMRSDNELRERRAAKVKYYTFEQMQRMNGNGYSDKDFAATTIDGQCVWYLKIDKINQQ